MRPPHGPGEFVDGDDGRGRNEFFDHPREILDALVEFQIHRSVQMVCGQTGFRRRAFTERQEQVRVWVVGQYDRDWSLDVGQPGIAQWPAHPGRVNNSVVAQQDQGIHTAIGHRRPQPRTGFTAHPLDIRCVRNIKRRRKCGQKRSG